MDTHKQQFSLSSCLPLVLLLLLPGQMLLQVEGLVFGDSYVDTGNTRKSSQSSSWKNPYGETFPGKPTGRWSDGRVLTDFVAKYLGVKSPIPYRLRNVAPQQYLKYGMNFAFGGTGVFKTFSSNPNMTTQIDFFNQLVQEKVFSASDLTNSVAYISVAGNDYNHYLATNGSIQAFPSFVASMVKQTTKNLIRIQRLGVKKIVVGALEPLGCFPQTTATNSVQRCNSTLNNLGNIHNNLLNRAVTNLNKETNGRASFVILDLYNSFLSVLNNTSSSNVFKDPLTPCCVGVSKEYRCGSVDEKGVKKYKVCENPKSAFFWDLLHPTQAGWNAVFNNIQKTNALLQLRY